MSTTLVHRKICMLGMFGVGKTSLTRRFVYDIYDDVYLSTIGVKVSQKLLAPIETAPGKLVQFNFLIWDVEGFDKNSPRFRNYLVGTSAALLVADLTRPETVKKIPEIRQVLHEVAPQAKAVLAGNKRDLITKDAEGVALLNETGLALDLPFFLTSAKTGENVEACFKKIGLLIAL